jgi:putative transposase
MKARFTDEQIIAMIEEQEAGEMTDDESRRHGISPATFYKYKSKYGGMEPCDAKRLRALEDENGMLKSKHRKHPPRTAVRQP